MRKIVFVSIVILAALIISGCTEKPAETPKATTPTPAKTTPATTPAAPVATATVAAATPVATTKAVKYSASDCTILTADDVNSVTKSSNFVFETGTAMTKIMGIEACRAAIHPGSFNEKVLLITATTPPPWGSGVQSNCNALKGTMIGTTGCLYNERYVVVVKDNYQIQFWNYQANNPAATRDQLIELAKLVQSR